MPVVILTRTIKVAGLFWIGILTVAIAGCISIDIVAPSVVSTTPEDGATGIPLAVTITATFSETIKPALLNSGTFTLTSAQAAVSGAVSFAGLTATFTPDNALLPNTAYTATVTRGVKDFTGNALVADFSWNFTTVGTLPTVSFTTAAQTVPENVGTVTVTATLSTLSDQDVQAPFIVSGSTANPSDHDLIDGTITILAGTLSGEVTFTVNDDTLDESDETVILTLGIPGNALLGATQRHTVTINDDDLPNVSWATNGQTVNESPASCPCAVNVTATLSSVSSDVVTVPYTVSGTATVGDDFSTPAPNPLIIAAGTLSTSLLFNVFADVQSESSEFVILTILTPTNANLGTTVQHSVEILDDE